jgi:uncharacterized cupredoxin-like copper-binding protein
MRRSGIATAVLLTASAGVLLGGGSAGAAHRATNASVGLKEFKITMATKLKAGSTTFQLKNTGKFPHNLVVAYSSGTKFASKTIAAGKSGTLTVNLKPGGYVLMCSVGSGYHASQGMVHNLAVGTFDFSTGKWKA